MPHQTPPPLTTLQKIDAQNNKEKIGCCILPLIYTPLAFIALFLIGAHYNFSVYPPYLSIIFIILVFAPYPLLLHIIQKLPNRLFIEKSTKKPPHNNSKKP